MRRRLSQEDAALQRELRSFFETEVPVRLREPTAQGAPPERGLIVETHRILHGAGLAVPHWPVEWGGRNWSRLQLFIWEYELSRAGVFPPLAPNVDLVGPLIVEFGSAEMKAKFLPPTASLDIFWCQGFSEPEAGSDLASVRTSATREDDGSWRVNGQKTWTSLAHMADWIFCLVRTSPLVGKRQVGLSMVLIDLSAPGITVRPIETIDGGCEVNEVFFDDVSVPAAQVVGEVGRGWGYAKFLLGNERVSASNIGHTKLRLARAKRHAAEPMSDGRRPLDNPLMAARIADLENDLISLELTALRVVGSSRDGNPDPASSILKLRGSELQQAVSELVLDLAGAESSMSISSATGAGLPRWVAMAPGEYLNLRKASIWGGTSEIQRTIIARTILGL